MSVDTYEALIAADNWNHYFNDKNFTDVSIFNKNVSMQQ